MSAKRVEKRVNSEELVTILTIQIFPGARKMYMHLPQTTYIFLYCSCKNSIEFQKYLNKIKKQKKPK